MALIWTAIAVALRWAAPSPPPLGRRALAAWLSGTAPADMLVSLAGWCAWLCLCWLLLGVVVVLLAELPGVLGDVATATAHRVTPVLLRRAVQAALGTALVTSPFALAAGPAGAAAPTASVTQSADSRQHPATGWPDLDRPRLPVTSPGRSTTVPDPATGTARAPRPATGTVVVRDGDTLWDIARRALPQDATPAQVAALWPRWYAANRQVIGPDPNLLRPGQTLRAPHRR